MPAGQLTLQPGIVYLALLHIVLADGTALRCPHIGIGNADRFAVHFQLEQYAERIAEQIAAAVHAAGAAVSTIAEGNQQFIFALVQQWGHIISLCTEVLVPGKATGSQDHITNAYTVQPCNIQTFGGDVQPCVPLWRGKKFCAGTMSGGGGV